MRPLLSAALMALLLLPIVAPPASAIEDDAKIIYIRKDCEGMTNCTERIADARFWTWNNCPNTNFPTECFRPDEEVLPPRAHAGNRIIWDIGPGIWNEQFLCNSAVTGEENGYVTVRGAGRSQTIIRGGAVYRSENPANFPDGGPDGGKVYRGCHELDFIDITFSGTRTGFTWNGLGSSTWTNVDLISRKHDGTEYNRGWEDYCLANELFVGVADHHYFGTRIISNGAKGEFVMPAAFYASCSRNWFYGGEIRWNITEGEGGGVGPLSPDSAAVVVDGMGEFRAFGTAIRATVKSKAKSGTLYGVRVEDNATCDTFGNCDRPVFEMHGGVISVEVQNDKAIDATALRARGGNSITSTNDTAFAVSTSNGTNRRVEVVGAEISSPYAWESGIAPPIEASIDGADLYVETDCSATGGCDGSVQESTDCCCCNDASLPEGVCDKTSQEHRESHVMIYNEHCGSLDPTNPWFDVVTGQCRVATTP